MALIAKLAIGIVLLAVYVALRLKIQFIVIAEQKTRGVILEYDFVKLMKGNRSRRWLFFAYLVSFLGVLGAFALIGSPI